MIWGYANQKYSFKTAALLYPVLIITLSFFHIVPTSLSTFVQQPGVLLALATLASSLIPILCWGFDKFGQITPDTKKRSTWSYCIALVLFAFALVLITKFFDHRLTPLLKSVYSTKSEYVAIRGSLLFASLSAGILYSIIFGLGFGTLLYLRGPKYYWVAGVTMLSTLAITIGVIINGVSVNSFNTQIYGYIALGAIVPLILSFLKEFAYFGIEKKSRFAVKLTTDFILFSLTGFLGTILAFSPTMQKILWGSGALITVAILTYVLICRRFVKQVTYP